MLYIMSKKTPSNPALVTNRKAGFDYHLDDHYLAGIVLTGWEIKALRAGRIQIQDSYVILKNQEAFWLGGIITPLASASTHVKPDSTRTRKLLLTAAELRKLSGAVHKKGYTLVPTKLVWKNRRVKLEFALAEGKKKHDKRKALKDQDWAREKDRLKRTKLSTG